MNTVANLPSWLAIPLLPTQEWFIKLRQAAWQAFLATGLPTKQNERWKYADLNFLHNKNYLAIGNSVSKNIQETIAKHRLPIDEAILLVCVNGFFIPELSELDRLPPEMTVCNLTQAISDHSAVLQPLLERTIDATKFPFATLNLAMSVDGIFIHQPKQASLTLPIHILSIADSNQPFIAHPLHCFMLGADLTLLESYHHVAEADYLLNSCLQIELTAGVNMKHYKLQQEATKAAHLAHIFVHQAQDTQYQLTNFSSGAQFARDEVVIDLTGRTAQCSTGGFYYLRGENQYIDNHIDILHSAPHTQSEMLYKGIVAAKARAVFNGRLHVKPGSQKILAYQANHNLLLSKLAEVYSKPELEIYADDVKCKHGATTGQVDNEALFYLRARGIDYDTALGMLLSGFADEIIARISMPSLRTRIREIL